MKNSGSERLDMVIVGAGFSGMYMLHRARGLGLSARVYEAAAGVGGTWYWNRYPGARCDVQSLEYSYQFSEELQQQWEWTERYAGQPEILRYANHVAERFDLRRDIRFETRVIAASFDEQAGRWQVRTDTGEETSAQYLIMATGSLSSTNIPPFKGIESFAGRTYHTGRWPHEGVDFRGQRVGVIGTGSSGIQAIPEIAKQARELTVFQRTANFSLPMDNSPLDPEEVREIKADYKGFRERNSQRPAAGGSRRTFNTASVFEASEEERECEFESRWKQGGFVFTGAFGDLMTDPRANEIAADFVRRKIRAMVHDPETAEKLLPHHTLGCKRLCLDSGYFETYNRPNVRLVDVKREPIEKITPAGIVAGGREHALDSIVFATGYDAMTGALLGMDIRGRRGLALREAWSAGPRTYLGLGVAGFPNLFIIAGPGSPSVLAVVVVAIEQQVNWIADCVAHLRAHDQSWIEAKPEAQDAWVEHVNAAAARTLYVTCDSWYLGANVSGKKRVFMPLVGYPPYVKKCDEVAANEYQGFALGR